VRDCLCGRARQIEQPGGDGLIVIQLHFEALELGAQASGDGSVVAGLDQALEQVPPEQPLARKVAIERREHAGKLGPHARGARSMRPLGSLVERQQPSFPLGERPGPRHARWRDARVGVKRRRCGARVRGDRSAGGHERIVRDPLIGPPGKRENDVVHLEVRHAPVGAVNAAGKSPLDADPAREGEPMTPGRAVSMPVDRRVAPAVEALPIGAPARQRSCDDAVLAVPSQGVAPGNRAIPRERAGTLEREPSGDREARADLDQHPHRASARREVHARQLAASNRRFERDRAPELDGESTSDAVEHVVQRLEGPGHEELGLRARDVVADLDASLVERALGDAGGMTRVTLSQGRQEPRAVHLVVVDAPDEAVLGRPPVKPRKASRLAGSGLARDRDRGRDLGLDACDVPGIERRILLRLAEGTDGAVDAIVLGEGKRLFPELADATQVRGEDRIRQDGRVPGGLVDDVRRGRVDEMLRCPHIGRNRQDAARLEVLKRPRRDESIHAHGAPPEARELLVHLGDTGNSLHRDSRRREPVPVGLVGGLDETRAHLQEHEPPHRLIDRGIRVVILFDDELPKMGRDCRRRVPHRHRTLAITLSKKRSANLLLCHPVRLATLRNGSRDGALIVVDGTAQRFAPAEGVAPDLQSALDDWAVARPALAELASRLERGDIPGQPLDTAQLLAPLPRAYEWVDGSSYLNHVVLARQARGAAPPPRLDLDPLVYQGGSGVLLAPTDPLELPDDAWGLDFEAEVCVVLGDVPRGLPPERVASHVRLVMLANDVTYRNLVPAELEKGFGFFNSKPATAFSPFAVTPDDLGPSFHDGRVFLRLHTTYNGVLMGDTETGPEMHFSFFDLVAHIARTRSFTAGTILGSGTVSNRDRARGVSCLAERRMIETLELGAPKTPFMTRGDTVRIEAFDAAGRSVFGAIDQRVL
jgi:fumarylacetoacetate (FAA) hydrolase